MQTLCSELPRTFSQCLLFTLNIFADTTRIADAIAIGDAPLITGTVNHSSISPFNTYPNVIGFAGEWSLATAFNTTFDFLRKWGDAQ